MRPLILSILAALITPLSLFGQASIGVSGGDLTVVPAIYGGTLVSNGTFPTDLAGWTGSNWQWSASVAEHVTGAITPLTQSALTATVGKTYRVTYTLNNSAALGRVRFYFGGVFGIDALNSGTYTDFITATSTDAFAFWPGTAFTGSVDNVVVQEITNNEKTVIDSVTEAHRKLTIFDYIEFPEGRPIRIGYDVLSKNSTGTYNDPGSNIGIGRRVGASTTTGQITGVGELAGQFFVDGSLTVFGKWAGRRSTFCYATFFGNGAGQNNLTGDGAAFGDEAGAFVQSVPIAVFGNYAGHSSTVEITAVGHHALRFNTTGKSTALGHMAGYTHETGNMIFIGHRAGYWGNEPVNDYDGIMIGDFATRSVPSTTILNDYIGIGRDVTIEKSHQTVIGTATITEAKLFGELVLPSTTQSTSLSTGSFRTAGGIAVMKDAQFGADMAVTGRLIIGPTSFATNFPLRIKYDVNNNTVIDLTNVDTGSAAAVGFNFVTDAGAVIFRHHSLAHSIWPGKTVVHTPSTGSGFVFNSGGPGDPIQFSTNNTVRGEWNDSGLLIGTGTAVKRLRHGTATLASGTVTISDSTVTASSEVLITRKALNGSTAIGSPSLGTVTAGTSFVINSLKPDTTVETGETSIVTWVMIEP